MLRYQACKVSCVTAFYLQAEGTTVKPSTCSVLVQVSEEMQASLVKESRSRFFLSSDERTLRVSYFSTRPVPPPLLRVTAIW